MAYLLGHGAWADINKRDEEGVTPLMYACMAMRRSDGNRQWHEIPSPTQIKYLLCHGAKASALAFEVLEATSQVCPPDEPARGTHIY